MQPKGALGESLDIQQQSKSYWMFFLQYLFKTRRVASKLRLDRGTETSGMATMHAYLPQQHSVMEDFRVMDMVIYGALTSNQVRVALVSRNQD